MMQQESWGPGEGRPWKDMVRPTGLGGPSITKAALPAGKRDVSSVLPHPTQGCPKVMLTGYWAIFVWLVLWA